MGGLESRDGESIDKPATKATWPGVGVQQLPYQHVSQTLTTRSTLNQQMLAKFIRDVLLLRGESYINC